MISRALPLVYERWWRPLGARVFMLGGPGQRGEERIATAMLALHDEDRVLDVACGTGIRGGWQRGWEPWVTSGSVDVHGGWACIRALVKVGAQDWRVDNTHA